jgi:DNA polymerase I
MFIFVGKNESMPASVEDIEHYLEGYDNQEHIVGIESSYRDNRVHLIIHDPKKGKRIERHKLKPFLWMKTPDVSNLYEGDRRLIKQKMREFGIKFTPLKTTDEDGQDVQRLLDGYKFLVTCKGTYGDLLNFFKDGGMGVYDEEHRNNFMAMNPTEQYLIQTGKRLFKGMEEYKEVHRFSFDLETTGLDPTNPKNRIFQIGMKDNRGFEHILEIDGDTRRELREREAEAIITFFKVIDYLKPAIIAGYNSENFDWYFIVERCKLLGIDITKAAKTLGGIPFYRKRQSLKMGPEMEYYDQTHMWGYNIMDVSHAVRRAQAINSSIKKWSLKYITKYAKAEKPNRVYIPGDKISKTWEDKVNDYWFNEETGEWGMLNGELPENTKKVKGDYIVQRYLIDDLWETEVVDDKFNQATYLLSKILPTSFMRSSTMGTAATWKLLMLGWSYHNGVAIPKTEPLRPFIGGLSRLLEVGYSQNVVKFDFDGLYPSEQLTHGIFTKSDVTGAMRGLLQYNYDNRNKYKKLKKEFAAKGDYVMSAYYDTKQLPLKILNNGMFGSISAPNVFPWGDTNMGEKITCTGRQYLRHMIRFMHYKGFRPLVGDTDGFNFSIPNNVDELTYTSNGRHHSTDEGVTYTGLEAVVAEYNDKYMYGVMGLSIDEVCQATINLARKNYADLIDGEVKLVGNTIKSKKLPTYIAEFIDKGIELLLYGKGYEFVNEYYDTVEAIYNQEIPLSKIANKSRVRMTVADYKKRATQVNRAGNPMPKQAHMELILKEELNVDLGDTIYYVNVGTRKSHGDIQTKTNKTTKEKEVIINCRYISNNIIENDPEATGEYNVPRYLDAFNKRIKPLLVCFDPEVRDDILITSPEDRQYFTEQQLQLTSGQPYNETDQDNLEDLLTITHEELEFWKRINTSPTYMFEEYDIVDEFAYDKITSEMSKTI